MVNFSGHWWPHSIFQVLSNMLCGLQVVAMAEAMLIGQFPYIYLSFY